MSNGVLDIYEKLMICQKLAPLRQDLDVLNERIESAISVHDLVWLKSQGLYQRVIKDRDDTKALIEPLEKRLQELTGEANG